MKCLALTQKHESIRFSNFFLHFDSGHRIVIGTKSIGKTIAGVFRIFERLFRIEPRCASFISSDLLVIAFQRKLWVVSLHGERVIKSLCNRKGFSDVLTFCSMAEHGENAVYYGDYGMNPNNLHINIYRLDDKINQKIVYTFSDNTIRHIHNIIYDKWRDRFFVFTGDEGDRIGIYIANRDFSSVEPFLIGSQQYRCVVGKVLEHGLLYATDAVMEDNALYYISFDGEEKISKIVDLPGSVIYGTTVKDGLLFSTTVEPYPSKKSRLLSLLDNRKGKGIRSNEIYLYYVSDSLDAKVLKTFKKDWLPMRLFQYGCIQFPALESQEMRNIICNGVAVKEYDGKQFEIDLSKVIN